MTNCPIHELNQGVVDFRGWIYIQTLIPAQGKTGFNSKVVEEYNTARPCDRKNISDM